MQRKKNNEFVWKKKQENLVSGDSSSLPLMRAWVQTPLSANQSLALALSIHNKQTKSFLRVWPGLKPPACLDPSVLVFSLSLHRHPSICILFSSPFTSHSKQTERNSKTDIFSPGMDLLFHSDVLTLSIFVLDKKLTLSTWWLIMCTW